MLWTKAFYRMLWTKAFYHMIWTKRFTVCYEPKRFIVCYEPKRFTVYYEPKRFTVCYEPKRFTVFYVPKHFTVMYVMDHSVLPYVMYQSVHLYFINQKQMINNHGEHVSRLCLLKLNLLNEWKSLRNCYPFKRFYQILYQIFNFCNFFSNAPFKWTQGVSPSCNVTKCYPSEIIIRIFIKQ